MSDSLRLSKRLSSQINCSRGEAIKYIESGYVTVDGAVIEEPGYHVDAEQQIMLLPNAKIEATDAVTILLHKPSGYDIETNPEAAMLLITPENHAQDDRSPNRFIKKHLKDLTLTEPLGSQTSGLVVLTQDWRIARKLIDDAKKIEQEYIVEVSGELLAGGLEQLNLGVMIKDKPTPAKVSWQSENKLRFAFKGIPRGHIPKMCSKVGLTVLAMKRIRIGRVPMATLQIGQWRYLLAHEQF